MGSHRIRKIDTSSPPVIRTIAGMGISGFREGTPPVAGTLGRFYSPSRVATTLDGKVYIVDNNNNRVRMLEPTGDPWVYTLSTFMGGTMDKDCGGGSLKGEVATSELSTQLKAGLNAVCVGKPSVVTSRSSCIGTEGTQTMAIAQIFVTRGGSYNYSHIIRLTQPCP